MSALTPLLSAFSSFQLVDGVIEFLHRERLLGVVRTYPRVCVRASSSLTCGAPRRVLRINPQYPVSRLCCCRLRPAHVSSGCSYVWFLIEVVFVRSRKVLRMLAMLCRLSSFLIVRIFFLIILLVSFLVCLSSFGVVCVSK